MRFLVDRCVGRRLAEWLRNEGHDVLESPSLGPDPGDRALLERAADEHRVLQPIPKPRGQVRKPWQSVGPVTRLKRFWDRLLVTIDTDFGRLVFAETQRQCGVLRLPDVRAERRIELVQEVLAHYGSELARGAVNTIKGNRIRISRPPT